MNEVHRVARVEVGAVDALQGLRQRVVTDRLALGRELLLAADHVRERVVEHGDFGAGWLRAEEELHVVGDDAGDPPGCLGPLGDLAVEVDQAVAARLVARAHRVVGVDVDGARAVGDGGPHPVAEVGADHRHAQLHPEHAVACLQLADVEAAV
jgi:hypothetical protein